MSSRKQQLSSQQRVEWRAAAAITQGAVFIVAVDAHELGLRRLLGQLEQRGGHGRGDGIHLEGIGLDQLTNARDDLGEDPLCRAPWVVLVLDHTGVQHGGFAVGCAGGEILEAEVSAGAPSCVLQRLPCRLVRAAANERGQVAASQRPPLHQTGYRERGGVAKAAANERE